jgi:hypothetical protein
MGRPCFLPMSHKCTARHPSVRYGEDPEGKVVNMLMPERYIPEIHHFIMQGCPEGSK